MPCPLAETFQAQSIWTSKAQYADAERKFHTKLQNDKNRTTQKLISENAKKYNKRGKKSTVASKLSDSIEQQIEKQNATTTNEENPIDESKHNAKAKTQKAKKDKKSAKKQQEDSNKSNVSSISDDKSRLSGKLDQPKPKSEIVKATKEKFSSKHDLSKDVQCNESFKVHVSGGVSEECTLVSEIAKARQHLKNSLERMDDIAALAGKDVLDRISALERENASLYQVVNELKKLQLQSENRIKSLEQSLAGVSIGDAPKPAVAAATVPNEDDVDLFDSDSEEEDDAIAKIREQRLAEYAAKKSKKPALIAKSNVILDVKPWDDETDMKLMEQCVRKIECDGLLWGTARLVPLAFGIHKLTISCVVEDEKVSIDWLTEEIEKNDEYVQSVDVAAFNKI
ncbi:probable elongation factor 1-delta isoform X1 [Contarinia nasturtii]|uniref:probable elongation factor 1-delta isoform X1 n=1 Tax=Contarinia nasturtii TaxID=265458 RepID=UPI0012D3ADF5|nr:probable elongation factor 1-delta isoform X1 [Contarinia nasturtii]